VAETVANEPIANPSADAIDREFMGRPRLNGGCVACDDPAKLGEVLGVDLRRSLNAASSAPPFPAEGLDLSLLASNLAFERSCGEPVGTAPKGA
jgi:hypothetical protein